MSLELFVQLFSSLFLLFCLCFFFFCFHGAISLSLLFLLYFWVLELMQWSSPQCWLVHSHFLFLLRIIFLCHLSGVRPGASSATFPVYRSIPLIYSLVHFKNTSEYLTKGTPQAFIPLKSLSLISTFFVFLRHSFILLIFFFISACLIASASDIS